MGIAVLGIDLARTAAASSGLMAAGQVILRRRMQRKSIAAALGAKLSPCIIAMEACCGAHHLGPGSFDPGTHGSADVA